MTSLVSANEGLASILTEVSSIANYKKPATITPTTETAAAASMLTGVSSIGNYKRSNTTGGGRQKELSKSDHERRIKSLARRSYSQDTTNNNSMKNIQEIKDDNDGPPQDPNNSAAFYEVFDYSMSEVKLSEETKAPSKKKTGGRRASAMTSTTGERTKNNKDEEAGNDKSVSETYNVFDFSLSSVDPKLLEEPTPKKRVSHRSSVGGLSKDSLAAARARTRRAGKEVKQNRPTERKQRPSLVRRNSFGSVRDLNAKSINEKMRKPRVAPRSPGADAGHKRPKSPVAEKKQRAKSPNKSLTSPHGRRKIRGPRGHRRASMGGANALQKKTLQNAVNQGAVNQAVAEEDRLQHVRRLTKIQKSFNKASLAATECQATIITACPEADPSESAHEEESPTALSEGLQTLTQGVMSSLATMSGLKKKLTRSNTMG